MVRQAKANGVKLECDECHKSDADFIRRYGTNVSSLEPYRQRRGDIAFLLRYEDLVRQPD